MTEFWQDVRFETRLLLKSPTTLAVAALTLSLGIGANTAVFSLMRGLIFNPLPAVESASELVVVGSRTHTGEVIPMSYPNYRDMRDMNKSFQAMTASAMAPLSFSNGSSVPRRQWAELVSGTYFEVLGVGTTVGRPILASDDAAPGASPVVVLSHTFWRNTFNSDPLIVGRKVLLNGHPFEVVGVAREGFNGSIVGLSFDMFVPLKMQAQAFPFEAGKGSTFEQRDTQWLVVQGRLKKGTSRTQAQGDMSILGKHLLETYPNDQIAERAVLFALWRSPFGAQSYLLPAVSMLAIVGLLVLLVACSNVANLLFALASRRSGEIAIRLAMGASRRRLIRQVLTGSFIVSFTGAVLGVLGAFGAAHLLRTVSIPSDFPILLNAGLDGNVLLFSLILTTLVGSLIGIIPALRISKVSLNAVLRAEGSNRAGRKTLITKGILVTQIAVSLVLLAVAGMMIRNVFRFQEMSPGFDPHHVMLTSLDLGSSGYDEAAGHKFFQQLLQNISTEPGVTVATAAWQMPLAGPAAPSTGVSLEGYEPRAEENMIFHYNVVAPNYLKTLEIPLLDGRDFSIADAAATPKVAIVNETLARRFWPGSTALGRKISAVGESYQIVGVAKDSKYMTMSEAPQAFVYLSLLQNHRPQVTLLVRGNGPPLSLQEPIHVAVSKLDASLALTGVRTLEQHVASSMFGFKAIGGLLAMAGLLALSLAAVGVYGMAAQAVAFRLPEIGLRVALGASPKDVFMLVVGGGMKLTLVGAAIGLVLSIGATRFLQRIFQGVNGLDYFTFACIALILGLVVLAASWFPAIRASRFHPSTILREQ